MLQHFSSAMLHVLSTQVSKSFSYVVCVLIPWIPVGLSEQAFKHLSSLTSAHFNYARQLTAQVGCGSVLAVCCRFATYPGASNCCKLGKHMMTEMLKSKQVLLWNILADFLYVFQILKDGMQHAGKLICSSMGARMDSEPKSWRILGEKWWYESRDLILIHLQFSLFCCCFSRLCYSCLFL